MNRILVALLVVVSSAFSQTKLDSLIDVGNKYYNEGQKEKGLKVWKEIISKANDSTATFGTTMQNIQFYYEDKEDEINLVKNYQILMKSNVNDRSRNYKIGEPCKNYRYHSTMKLAFFYARNKKFNEALKYLYIADKELTYHTTSLTKFIFNKVDLALWINDVYRDLNDKEKALAVLIHRALEYNYKGMCPNWATVQKSNDELELAQKIIENQDVKKLKSELDVAFNSLVFKTDKSTIIVFSYRGIKYEINVYDKYTSKDDCLKYLKNSFFYNFLVEKGK